MEQSLQPADYAWWQKQHVHILRWHCVSL